MKIRAHRLSAWKVVFVPFLLVTLGAHSYGQGFLGGGTGGRGASGPIGGGSSSGGTSTTSGAPPVSPSSDRSLPERGAPTMGRPEPDSRSTINFPERNDPSDTPASPAPRVGVAVPADAPRPIVRRRGIDENRGQDDLGNIPAVQKVVSQSGEPTGGKLSPAWADAYPSCNAALVELRRTARIAEFLEPKNEQKENIELAFLKSCLGPVSQDLEARVGRLLVDGKIACTVFMLTAKRALTARHCLYEKYHEPNATEIELRPSFSDDSVLLVEIGPIDKGRRSRIASILLLSSGGSLTWTQLKDLQSPMMTSFDTLNDLMVLQLDADVTSPALPPIGWTELLLNDKIVLPAFHEPTYLEKKAGDSGLRQQIAGYCQVIQLPTSRCLQHACSTTSGSSGAPILVERIESGVKVLHLAGIHTSGSRKESGCPGDPALDGVLNFGVVLNNSEYEYLMEAKQ